MDRMNRIPTGQRVQSTAKAGSDFLFGGKQYGVTEQGACTVTVSVGGPDGLFQGSGARVFAQVKATLVLIPLRCTGG